MGSMISDIGIGTVAAVMILREVFAFLKDKKSNGKVSTSGEQSIDFWKLELKTAIADSLESPMSTQNEILRNIQGVNSKTQELVQELVILARQESGNK